jgi:hypothetical protein
MLRSVFTDLKRIDARLEMLADDENAHEDVSMETSREEILVETEVIELPLAVIVVENDKNKEAGE